MPVAQPSEPCSTSLVEKSPSTPQTRLPFAFSARRLLHSLWSGERLHVWGCVGLICVSLHGFFVCIEMGCCPSKWCCRRHRLCSRGPRWWTAVGMTLFPISQAQADHSTYKSWQSWSAHQPWRLPLSPTKAPLLFESANRLPRGTSARRHLLIMLWTSRLWWCVRLWWWSYATISWQMLSFVTTCFAHSLHW